MFKRKTKIIAAIALTAGVVAGLAACTSDADKASENLSTAAEQFEVQRLIVGVNGITDKVEFSVEGRCSIEPNPDQVVVVCKQGENDYRKHYLGLSDNMFYIATQLDPVDVSVYNTRIILKPENILPNFDLETGKQ
jgi:hypothetical protein